MQGTKDSQIKLQEVSKWDIKLMWQRETILAGYILSIVQAKGKKKNISQYMKS